MSLHHYHEGRRISSRTPLYDHAGAELGKYPAREIIRLIDSGRVFIIGTKHRIKGLRFLGPDPARLAFSGSRHRRPVGAPHTHENYYNPPGCWHLDRIPSSLRPLFSIGAPATIFVSMVML